MLLVFSIYLILDDSLAPHLWASIAILASTTLSKISVLRIFKVLRNVMFFVIFIVILHSVFTKGDEIFSFWFISISAVGFEKGMVYALRLVLMVWAASLFGFTTRPVDITDALEQSLAPLSKLKLPVRDFSMIMLLSMRFIPSVFKDADQIRLAQRARGHSLKKGVKDRITGLIPLIVPLFAVSFKRADTIALALEVKGYNSFDERSFYKKWKLMLRDVVSFTSFLFFLGFSLAL